MPMASTEARLAERLTAQSDRLMPCVHCGFCLPVCPTYTRLGDEADSPRGRLYLMRAVVEGRLDAADDAFQDHIDRCLGCRACETVCPSGVEYGLLLEAARSVAIEARPPAFLNRLLLSVFGSDGLRSIVLAGGRIMRGTGVARLVLRALPDIRMFRNLRLALAMLVASGPAPVLRKRERSGGAAVGVDRGAPRVDGGDTHIAGKEATSPPRSGGTADLGARQVTLLRGCVQAGLFSRVNDATERTLRANGLTVIGAPNQGCCGALHAHTGDVAGAQRLAKRNIAAFERSGADLIAVNAAGCGAAMREYGHLLAEDPEWAGRAAAVAARVRDVSEILANEGPRQGSPLALRVTYDAPCHLHHAQKVTRAPLDLLRAVPGLEMVPLPGTEECCGGAGIYGLTHPELGGQIGADKVTDVLATGAELVATGNPGCMMQIGAGLELRGARVHAVHPVELLDASYRKAGYYVKPSGGPGPGP